MKLPTAKKLKSGAWRTQVQIGGRRISVTAATRKECELQANILKTNYQQTGQIRSSGDIILGAAIDEYISERSNVLSPSTIRGYNIIRRNRFQTVMNKRIKDINSWQRLINTESELVSPKTLQNAWGLINAVLNSYGYDPGPVRLPLTMPEERSFLEPEQLKTFINAIHGDLYELQYLLCLHGLRRSEMLALEKADVTDSIHVVKSRVPGADHRLVVKNTTKNKSSARTVPVFVSRLKELVEERPDGRLIKTDPDRLNKHLRKICQNNDLPVVTLHGLRHSFASLCYHLKISELQCMELGGWSDLTTMRKIYTHVADSDRKRAASDLSAFFGG